MRHRGGGSTAGVLVMLVALAASAACGSSSTRSVGPAPSPQPPTTTTSASQPATLTPPASPTSVRSSHAPPSPSPTRTQSPTALPVWLAGDVVTRLPTTRHVIALTFDGGSGAEGAASVLATLTRERVPATFFLTGRFVAANPALVPQLARGNVVGDHTMTHPHLPQLSSAAATAQVRDAGARVAAATGRPTQPWFRFPYGEYDARTLSLVHALGYGAIGWTVDTRGWQGRSAGTVGDVVTRVRGALRPGAIVLMHLGANPDDGTTFDADALPAVIAAARAAGYSFVTVAG